MRKFSSYVVCFLLILTLFIGIDMHLKITQPAKGAVIYVGGAGPGNHSTVQGGINASGPGDTIFVYNGTYNENIILNFSVNLIGENRENTIINGGGSGDVVSITADWVNINGFGITDGGNGFYLLSSEYINISHNYIWDNTAITYQSGNGIYSRYSNHTIISDNVIWNNYGGEASSGNGISLYESDNFTIVENLIFNNSDFSISAHAGNGITLENSNYCRIESNTVHNNTGTEFNSGNGIFLFRANNNRVHENVVMNNTGLGHWCGNGIDLRYESHNNIITNNTIFNNWGNKQETGNGMHIFRSINNSIINNVIYNNNGSHLHSGNGIWIIWADYSMISHNLIYDNKGYANSCGNGIKSAYSDNSSIKYNRIWNNIGFGDRSGNGLEIAAQNDNNISYNIIWNNSGTSMSSGNGLWMAYSSTHNVINNNTFWKNSNHGINLSSSTNNTLYHNNIVDNGNQSYDDSNNSNLWDNGYPSGGNFWSDYNGTDYYRGPGQNISGSDGIGDTPYIIDSDSWDNYPLMDPTGNFTLLRPGWNLISVPRIQFSSNTEDVLYQINGSYSTVQWFNADDGMDHWKHNSVNKPTQLTDLITIDHTIGFWIYITEQDGVFFEYLGLLPDQNQLITLYPGWNMVGYPSLSTHNQTAALNNLVFGTHVDSVWGFDSATQSWEEIGPSDYFEFGKGYWVHATQDCMWEVPL